MAFRPVLIVSAVAALAACSGEEPAAKGSSGTIQVTDAVCRPSAPGRRMALCFMTLTANRPDTLVSASSPLAGRASVQDVPYENGMMVIQPRTAALSLPAGQPVPLAPGGQTVALQGLRTPLLAGQTTAITLTFGTSSPVEVVVPVEAEPAA